MIWAATASGVVENGCGVHARGHAGVHEPGPHDHDPGAGADQRVAQALGEGVEAGLGGAVDVVGCAGPLGRDRRQHDQRAVALGAQAVGDDQAATTRRRRS